MRIRSIRNNLLSLLADDNSGLMSNEPLLRYVMEDQDYAFFTSGMARRVATRALCFVDNRGWSAGIGNYEDCRPGHMMYASSTGAAIGITAFYYQDGGLKWLTENAARVSKPTGGGEPFVLPEGECLGAFAPLEANALRITRVP